MIITSSPTLQFGRSWFVELKIGSTSSLNLGTIEPFKVTLQLQKNVDPSSGMTINLMSVDQAWHQAQDLKEGAWSTPLDFLNSLAEKWQSWITQEQACLIYLKIETLGGDLGWELNPRGLFYKTLIRLQISANDKKSLRKCFLKSQRAMKPSDLNDFSDLIDDATFPDQLLKLIQENRDFCRLEIYDLFEQFIEFDLQY